MGYRSEWKLAVHGTKECIDKFLGFLETPVDPAFMDKEVRDVVDTILAYKTVVDKGKGIIFYDDSTKCGYPWREVITQIEERCEELGLDYAYARLGEDFDDSEFDNSPNLCIRYERSLCEVDGMPNE